jgi:hypothetical protein
MCHMLNMMRGSFFSTDDGGISGAQPDSKGVRRFGDSANSVYIQWMRFLIHSGTSMPECYLKLNVTAAKCLVKNCCSTAASPDHIYHMPYLHEYKPHFLPRSVFTITTKQFII